MDIERCVNVTCRFGWEPQVVRMRVYELQKLQSCMVRTMLAEATMFNEIEPFLVHGGG